MKKISFKIFIYALLALLSFGAAGYLFYIGIPGIISFFGWKNNIDTLEQGIASFLYMFIGGGMYYIILAISVVANIIAIILIFIGFLFAKSSRRIYISANIPQKKATTKTL